MDRTVKVGAKRRHLEIPDGWELVKDGRCREGDMFANVGAPTPIWQHTDSLDWGCEHSEFDALIRRNDK